jgi:hypothetical protein
MPSQFGPLVLIDRIWYVEGVKSTDFLQLFYRLFAVLPTMPEDNDNPDYRLRRYEHARHDAMAKDAVLGIAHVLGGPQAHESVSQLLDADTPGLERTYKLGTIPFKHRPNPPVDEYD